MNPAAPPLALPLAVSLALHGNTALASGQDPAAAVTAALGSVPGRLVEHAGEPLTDWLARVAALPLAHLRPVLPVPGRIAGLAGGAPTITAALAAGQAIVVTAGGIHEHTLVPELEDQGRAADSEGMRIRWRVLLPQTPTTPGAPPAWTPTLPPSGASTAGARTELLAALRRAATGSTQLDLVPEEPLSSAEVPWGWTLTHPPRGLAAPALHLLELASRTLALTDNALAAEPAGTSLAAQDARSRVLRELHDAARTAVVDTVDAPA